MTVEGEIATFVEAVGHASAATLFLKFGGSRVHVPKSRSSKRSMLTRELGEEAVLALGRTRGHGDTFVPLANEYLARYLESSGASTAEIVRSLRLSEHTVRNLLYPKDHPKRIAYGAGSQHRSEGEAHP